MRYSIVIIGLMALLLNVSGPARLETRDFSEVEPSAPATKRIKWPRRAIQISFSNSLLSPGPHIKPGSDVVGAARRALFRWSSIATLNFVVSWTTENSISPADDADGISLLTVADTPENVDFNADATTGRTRVFFDPETGIIKEADIAINPRPRSAEGADLQFSTDGTPGTYDLEATFTHEIGHLLGLDHSNVLSATMQSHQAFNGTYGLPAFNERTLSEDDRQRVRLLYGPKHKAGKIEGRFYSLNGVDVTSLSTVHVWAESVATGRVVASDTTADDGSYSLGELPPGIYRVIASAVANTDSDDSFSITTTSGSRFSSVEIGSQINVVSETVTALNYNLLPAQHNSELKPRMIGLNGDLSLVALPVESGKKFRVYLSGEGVDNVPGTNISVNSPYFAVDASSLVREEWSTSLPVVSFEVNVAANAPFGDYTLRLQSNSGEIAHLPGALTIDPGVLTAAANPIDDSRFFIQQLHKDLMGNEAAAETVERLLSQLESCGSRAECLRARKLEISSSLLLESASVATSAFVHAIYTVGLGRRPTFSEFQSARSLINRDENIDANQLAVAVALVGQAEFGRKYLGTSDAEQFLDAIITSLQRTTGVSTALEKHSLLPLSDGTNVGRARILMRLVERSAVINAQHNENIVLLHYFSYLRRDPDTASFEASVNMLKNKPLRDPAAMRSLVCSFINSSEYQARFAMLPTRYSGGCN